MSSSRATDRLTDHLSNQPEVEQFARAVEMEQHYSRAVRVAEYSGMSTFNDRLFKWGGTQIGCIALSVEMTRLFVEKVGGGTGSMSLTVMVAGAILGSSVAYWLNSRDK